MSSERVDWVEIIEPKTKEHMYANLTTGECVWDPPEGVNVKRTDSSQWWELFDNNTHRFYYYNATTQSTVWHRPVDCDIIPLAKLQTLKQNTDPQQRRETATQTNQVTPQVVQKVDAPNVTNGITPGASRVSPSGVKSVPQTQTSPMQSRRSLQHCGRSENRRTQATPAGYRHTDSGRSSDSSISSAQQRRQQEAAMVLPLSTRPAQVQLSGTPQLKKRGSSGPAVVLPLAAEGDKWTPQAGLNRSGSFMSPRKDASDDSMHEKYFKSVESTPLTRRKLKQQSAGGSSCESASPQSPSSPQQRAAQRVQPYLQPTSARPSLVSSISLATEQPVSPAAPRGMQSLERGASRHQPSPLERNARERYSDRHLDKERFLDLERNLDRGYPDKQAVYGADKPFRQTSLDLRHQQPAKQAANWQGGREFTRRQQAEPERYTSSKQSVSSGGSRQHQTPGSLSDASHTSAKLSNVLDHHNPAAVASFGLKSLALEPPLTKPNLERHNLELEKESQGRRRADSDSTGHRSSRRRNKAASTRRQRHRPIDSGDELGTGGGDEEEEDETGAGSPLYSNWDLRGMQHLLPLQHYIMEQAKLSGCYRFGDTLGTGDSDSLHSESGSGSGASGSRSLSGHEPDNESSDGAGRTDEDGADDDDGDGVYLPHTCCVPPSTAGNLHDDEYMNHGVSYYNTFVGFERDNQPPIGIQRTQSAGGGAGPGLAGATTTTGTASRTPSREQPLYSPVRSLAPVSVPQLAEQDIEKFARDNLNLKAKGIFRKKASVRDMLSWTSSSISAPMIGVRWDKTHKKAATDLFRLVQIYMGDRKARPGMTLNSVAQDILHATYTDVTLRDELYVQLCRQTTENPLRDSLLRGWELLAVCLAFVPPSRTFQPALTNYVNRHRDPAFADAFPEVGKWPIHVQVSHYAGVACRRLERIGHGGKRQPRKPSTDDIDQARIQIFHQSMFGNTLTEVMTLQKDRFPNRQLPWVQVALSQQVLTLQGKQTEGIFRVSADVDEVNALKAKIDNWELPDSALLTDAHAPASLLKLWYRELYEPLIPDALYGACVAAGSDAAAALRILHRLPHLNRLVLTYLIRFLQEFTAPEVVTQTKMDSANLAMVFAPNCLRCTSQDPRIILENARKEMTFLRSLITNMDTSHVKDLL